MKTAGMKEKAAAMKASLSKEQVGSFKQNTMNVLPSGRIMQRKNTYKYINTKDLLSFRNSDPSQLHKKKIRW